MTNLKTVEEVAKTIAFKGHDLSTEPDVVSLAGVEDLLTQDRQSACDELVRRLQIKEVPPYPHEGEHGNAISLAAQRGYQDAIDQALTIVKEVYKGKE